MSVCHICSARPSLGVSSYMSGLVSVSPSHSPDPVQMVPGGTFILGHINMVRGSHGRWAGGEVVAALGNLVSECPVHFLAL